MPNYKAHPLFTIKRTAPFWLNLRKNLGNALSRIHNRLQKLVILLTKIAVMHNYIAKWAPFKQTWKTSREKKHRENFLEKQTGTKPEIPKALRSGNVGVWFSCFGNWSPQIPCGLMLVFTGVLLSFLPSTPFPLWFFLHHNHYPQTIYYIRISIYYFNFALVGCFIQKDTNNPKRPKQKAKSLDFHSSHI